MKVNITTQSITIDGRSIRLMSIRDVTHFTDIQDKLEQKHDRLEKAQQLAELGWWELNPQSGKVQWSQKLYEMLGLDHEDIEIETDFRKYVHPDDEEDLNRSKRELRTTHEPVEYLIRLQHSSGEYRHMKCRAQAVKSNDGKIELIRGVAQDVTQEQKNLLKAEQAKSELKNKKSLAKSSLLTYLTFSY